MEQNKSSRLLTALEVAVQLGCAQQTVFGLARRGRLTRVKRGNEVRFNAEEVERFAQTYTPPPMAARAALGALGLLGADELAAQTARAARFEKRREP